MAQALRKWGGREPNRWSPWLPLQVNRITGVVRCFTFPNPRPRTGQAASEEKPPPRQLGQAHGLANLPFCVLSKRKLKPVKYGRAFFQGTVDQIENPTMPLFGMPLQRPHTHTHTAWHFAVQPLPWPMRSALLRAAKARASAPPPPAPLSAALRRLEAARLRPASEEISRRGALKGLSFS